MGPDSRRSPAGVTEGEHAGSGLLKEAAPATLVGLGGAFSASQLQLWGIKTHGGLLIEGKVTVHPHKGGKDLSSLADPKSEEGAQLTPADSRKDNSPSQAAVSRR